MMLGKDAVEKLKGSHVAVFGVGGVGGFCVEALARAGVGKITLIDADRVSVSNINRQIIATSATVGQYKTEAMKARIADINPECEVNAISEFYSEENQISLDGIDYIADCIDSVRSKLHLITEAKRADIPIISSMGAGNKLDPTRFTVADISKTHTDPLAKVIRTELRKRGVGHLKVVFSDEPPINPSGERTPGSVSFVPSVVGLIMAGEMIKDITK
ncbi:MAG: tRNA threonylcarbamoyladenosine dehydratase [Clostridia bacterium]|nr:tRNA threonylcarbamoyladenosine dehydratase [Clostridia bacterium]